MHNNIQKIMDEIQNINLEIRNNCSIRIEYEYMLDASLKYVPHLIISLGRETKDCQWESLCINKHTKEWTFDNKIDWTKEKDNVYECFEGGYESDLKDCLEKILNNLKKYLN